MKDRKYYIQQHLHQKIKNKEEEKINEEKCFKLFSIISELISTEQEKHFKFIDEVGGNLSLYPYIEFSRNKITYFNKVSDRAVHFLKIRNYGYLHALFTDLGLEE